MHTRQSPVVGQPDEPTRLNHSASILSFCRCNAEKSSSSASHFAKIEGLRLPLHVLVTFWHAALHACSKVALSFLVEELSNQGRWSKDRHRFLKIICLLMGSHSPQRVASKRFGWALVLAKMVDGWACLGAQAASACHELKYELSDTSHTFPVLLAAGCTTVWHNWMSPRGVCLRQRCTILSNLHVG